MKHIGTIIKAGGVAALLQASILTTCLTLANGPLPSLAVVELAVVMLWIAGVVNLVFLAALGILWVPLRKLLGWNEGRWAAYLASGLAAMHLSWALLNRLTLCLSWMRPPRFMTWLGLLQLVALSTMAVCLILGGVSLRDRGRRLWSPLFLVLAIALAAGCLIWDSRMEVFSRKYTMEEIRGAAASGLGQGDLKESSREQVPIIVLALDGLSWSVMKPLLAAGKLPNLARLISNGSIGYLDNGNTSLSPVIWNVIFSGRSPKEHGIHGFRSLTLPRTEQTIADFLIVAPTIHSFYGLHHLVEVVPNPGLWHMSLVGSTDRKAKGLWDISSDFKRRVVVANPSTSLPVQPVNGLMIVYSDGGGLMTAFPPSLAKQWREAVIRSGVSRGGWRRYSAAPHKLIEKTRFEAEFTLHLFSEQAFDLGLYYNRLADDMSHLRWNFYSRDKVVSTDLPRWLTNQEWERLVLKYSEDLVFRAYVVVDTIVGKFSDRFPANYVVVSDHGWTYSGYEHYGSQDGIVILSGPAFRSGVNLSGARVEDITPTILSLLGIPLSRELSGHPLLAALRTRPKLVVINSYGEPTHSRKTIPSATNEEELQRLKSLGYIQ